MVRLVSRVTETSAPFGASQSSSEIASPQTAALGVVMYLSALGGGALRVVTSITKKAHVISIEAAESPEEISKVTGHCNHTTEDRGVTMSVGGWWLLRFKAV